MIHVRDSSDGCRRKAQNAKKQLREDKSHSVKGGGHNEGITVDGGIPRGMKGALHVQSHLSPVLLCIITQSRAKSIAHYFVKVLIYDLRLIRGAMARGFISIAVSRAVFRKGTVFLPM